MKEMQQEDFLPIWIFFSFCYPRRARERKRGNQRDRLHARTPFFRQHWRERGKKHDQRGKKREL